MATKSTYQADVLSQFFRQHGRAKDLADDRVQRVVDLYGSEAVAVITRVVASALADQQRYASCHRSAHPN